MTRFIPSEEIDQHSVRRWSFDSVDHGIQQPALVALGDTTLGPLLAPAPALPVEAALGMDAPAAEAAAQEEAAPEPAEPMVTEAEVQQRIAQAVEQATAHAHATAFQQGQEHGRQAAAQEWQQRLDDLQNNMGREVAHSLGQVLQQAQDTVQQLPEQLAQELLQLAIDIARQVVRQELRCNPQALQPVVAEALDMLGSESKPAVVRLHPQDFAHLQQHLRDVFPSSKLEWVADASVSAGGCVIESQGARIDGTLERRWQRAVAALGLVSTWYDEAAPAPAPAHASPAAPVTPGMIAGAENVRAHG